MRKALLAKVLSLGLASSLLFTATSATATINGPEFDSFIAEMVAKHNFDEKNLKQLFAKVSVQDGVITAISRPYEALPWHKYRNLFVTEGHIKSGIEFWKQYESALRKAEKDYGVPAEVIVAIIGVESRYGVAKGKYPVIESLSTLAFGYPPRAKFFRQELENYLLLTREENLDPLALTGSYAGAMGQPQFISSSYRHYAVDFDKDGKRDLINSPVDAIGSVANYFKRHGWEQGKPVAFEANVSGNKYKDLKTNTLDLVSTTKELHDNGIVPSQNQLLLPQKASLYQFETANGEQFWIGLKNFAVIMRYNHSHNYAMAVYQLSQELKKAKGNDLG